MSRLLPPPGLAPAQKAGPGVGNLPPCVAFFSADHGEPFKREWRPGAVSEKVLKRLTLDTHLGRYECDPDK